MMIKRPPQLDSILSRRPQPAVLAPPACGCHQHVALRLAAEDVFELTLKLADLTVERDQLRAKLRGEPIHA